MRKVFIVLIFALATLSGYCQYMTHSIEHEFHQVGVFNPQWEVEHTLNPTKYEHITGFYREELARIIFSAVSQKQVKIYDERKRELNLDSVVKKITDFEQRFSGRTLGKDSLWEYIIPFVSAYQFEEFVTYNYEDISLSKTVKAYCPYLVRYKEFSGEKNDTVMLPLFWIFPLEAEDSSFFHIPDTVLSAHGLKYPTQMPFSSSLFEFVKQKKIKVFQPNGEEFSTPKQVDDLFVLKNYYTYYDEATGEESQRTSFSDLMPEDIIAIRIGEGWNINPKSLAIKKEIYFYLPLYRYDDERFGQLGLRIWNKGYRK